ncbi:MAG: SufD family Fe-S cluster assembly protein [Candidatus Magasanikbacteria bacterium]|nr:SufD family Fe-S cluster assembly protein [Candidatus Magasanikbacteria bacterium]
MTKKEIRFIETIPNETITLAPKSDLVLVGLITQGWEGTREFKIDASGEGSSFRGIFFVLGEKKDSFLVNITSIHNANDTLIHTRVRAALMDSAVCNISGVAKVQEKIIGADSYFSHHTLLLSENSSAKAAPNLEIKSDSVKAGHAASVGKVDEEALFYLLSRGISQKDAKALLVQGFFETEMSGIEDEHIKSVIREALTKFLFK